MRALVTGASSGMGREMALILDKIGYETVITGRSEERLKALAGELTMDCQVIVADISKEAECFRLVEEAGEVDIVICNAGAGVHGPFAEQELTAELAVLDINIRALHILNKLYYKRFRERGHGYLMNVASSAAFFAGPYFASYYASKAYVLRLSEALWKEAKDEGADVGISVFCPGPVNTEFNARAGVGAPLSGMDARRAAELAIQGMLAKKRLILPGIGTKASYLAGKILPAPAALWMVARIQRGKMGR